MDEVIKALAELARRKRTIGATDDADYLERAIADIRAGLHNGDVATEMRGLAIEADEQNEAELAGHLRSAAAFLLP
jgi:cytochrome c553